MKGLNKNVAKLISSASIQQAEIVRSLKEKGMSVVDFTWGEPYFRTHRDIIARASSALKTGKTKYTLSRGILKLRQLISQYQREENNLNYNAEDEILITPGAKQAIFYALAGVINYGDEVIVPEPYWLSYKDIVTFTGGRLVGVKSSIANRFVPKISDLTKAVTSKTKAILLNTPVNPSGIVWRQEEIEPLCRLVLKKDLYIISDEIYDQLIFNGSRHISPLFFRGMKKRGILINGFSKTFAMTGWRLGYLCADRRLMEKIEKIHQHLATCSPEFIQLAAIVALKRKDKIYSPYVGYYQKVRDILYDAISKSRSLRALKPEGAFYMLVDISKFAADSISASNLLLKNYGLAVTPGIYYGNSAAKTVRLSFALPWRDIIKAAKTLRQI